uniref:Replication-associated protein n=2 Tax=Lactococcus TaxID=1357 RepID=I6S850_LACLC|nr:replication-associated protein [Lactococcus cremoris]AFM72745.1 replication-associated protein [Lactococcus cremoris]
MSEDLKTIKELADELGVSKSYVDKIIRILKLHTKLDKVGNKYVISKKQEKSIITRIENSKSTTETHTESTTQSHTKVDAEVDFLKEEIAYLKSNHDKQLTNKDKQIETLSNLLDQQQRLALQDKKLLEEYKAEINDLKALKMPSEDTKEEQSNYRSLEKEKDFVQTIQESYESEIKVLNQKLAEQEEQIQEIQKEKETKEKKRFQFWK